MMVASLLPPPGIDDLRAGIQIMSDLCDRPPSRHQIQDLPPQLGRISPWHTVLLELLDKVIIQQPDSGEPGNITSGNPGRFSIFTGLVCVVLAGCAVRLLGYGVRTARGGGG